MAKLTDKDKQTIYTDFASGKSKSDIAKKFNVSITAISKILEDNKSLEKFNKSLDIKPNKEYAKSIISKAYKGLEDNINKNIHKLHPETLIKIIERLSLLYKNTFDDDIQDNITKVEVVFEDASIVEDIQQESNNNLNNNGV